MSEQLQIPVELPVESVKAYVQGEQITPYNFDLLQNYFEGRIIKLLEPRLAQLGSDYCMCHLITDRIIALIKGEK